MPENSNLEKKILGKIVENCKIEQFNLLNVSQNQAFLEYVYISKDICFLGYRAYKKLKTILCIMGEAPREECSFEKLAPTSV